MDVFSGSYETKRNTGKRHPTTSISEVCITKSNDLKTIQHPLSSKITKSDHEIRRGIFTNGWRALPSSKRRKEEQGTQMEQPQVESLNDSVRKGLAIQLLGIME